MGCGASSAAYAVPEGGSGKPPVEREPMSEEDVRRLFDQAARRLLHRSVGAAFQKWVEFHKVEGPRLATERRVKQVLARFKNQPFVQGERWAPSAGCARRHVRTDAVSLVSARSLQAVGVVD